MRHFVIGDIHGHANALKAILDRVTPAATDRVTFLGDYVDRGPDSRGVIDLIVNLNCRVDAVLGNHEAMLVASVDDPEIERHWLMYGGDATLRSFGVKQAKDIPSGYRHWLASRPRFVETASSIFCHAYLNPMLSMDQQSTEDLLWRHNEAPIFHCSGKRVFCGHTPRTMPFISDQWVSLDTNIANGGVLSCIEIHSDQLFYADRFGFSSDKAA